MAKNKYNSTPVSSLSVCEGCGLELDGGTVTCQQMYDGLLARDFSSPLFFRMHRLMVDIYSLQHPDRYCKSAKSLAAHLCGMCGYIEGSASAAVGDESLRSWLDGRVELTKPEIPSFHGEMTIADVYGIGEPDVYCQAVERWAHSVWRAYASLHELAHDWLRQARS